MPALSRFILVPPTQKICHPERRCSRQRAPQSKDLRLPRRRPNRSHRSAHQFSALSFRSGAHPLGLVIPIRSPSSWTCHSDLEPPWTVILTLSLPKGKNPRISLLLVLLAAAFAPEIGLGFSPGIPHYR